jgi:hypothetical protein
MLVPELGLFLLNTPKCGSSTVKRCLEYRMSRLRLPSSKTKYIDHLPLSEMAQAARDESLDIDSLRVVGLVRSPVERYLSALNFVFGQEQHYPLERCVELSFCREFGCETFYRYDILFRPTHEFLDLEVACLDLYKFEDMAAAIQSFGYFGPIPHLQKSTQRFSLSDIKPYMEAIETFYKEDFMLYENTDSRPKENVNVC